MPPKGYLCSTYGVFPLDPNNFLMSNLGLPRELFNSLLSTSSLAISCVATPQHGPLWEGLPGNLFALHSLE